MFDNRLGVLRGVFATVANESKTPTPVNTDSRVLILLQKQAKASRAAAAEFEAAKRKDLQVKEEAQLAVLEEYIGSIPTVSNEEVSDAIEKILAKLKANGSHLNYGNVMRDLAGRNRVSFAKPLNMEVVRGIVQERIAAYEKT